MIRIMALIGLALYLACVATVQANPVTVIPYYSPAVLTALVGESLVVALLLAQKGFRPLRTFVSWYFITWGTLLLFELAFPLADGVVPEGAPAVLQTGVSLVLSETGIILLEAAILRFMSRHKFYHVAETVLTWKQALLVSAAGNAVSFIVGVLWPVESPWL